MTASVDRDSSHQLTDSLVQAAFTVIGLLSRAAAEHDVSLTQLRVLGILRDREPTMAELATHLGLERSSVSGLIDRAVRRGLVRRTTSDDDRRSVRVGLTPDGQRFARLLTHEVGDRVAGLARSLGTTEQRRLRTLLDKMLQ